MELAGKSKAEKNQYLWVHICVLNENFYDKIMFDFFVCWWAFSWKCCEIKVRFYCVAMQQNKKSHWNSRRVTTLLWTFLFPFSILRKFKSVIKSFCKKLIKNILKFWCFLSATNREKCKNVTKKSLQIRQSVTFECWNFFKLIIILYQMWLNP